MRVKKSIEKVFEGVEKDLKKIIDRNKNSFEIEKYLRIMEKSEDPKCVNCNEFQTMYNGFYKVRRNEAWREKYYSLFNKYLKDRNNCGVETFDVIIEELAKTSYEYIEISFTSKLLATLNPKMPLYDSQIAKTLDITGYEANDKTGKLKEAKEMYLSLTKEFKVFMETDTCERALSIFNQACRGYGEISPVKKIDYILWSIGK